MPGPGPGQCDLNLKRTLNFSMARLQLEHSPGPGAGWHGSHSVMYSCAGWLGAPVVSYRDAHGHYRCRSYNVMSWNS